MRGIWPEEQPSLTDGVVVLRPWRLEDADAVLRACQDPDIQHYTQVPVPYLREHAVDFVGSAPGQWADGTGAQFAVLDPSSGELVGCMGLMEADHQRRQVVAGYWTAPGGRARGMTRRALRLATQWALTDGGFDTVLLEVEEDNPRSTAVVLAVGYERADHPIDSRDLKGTVRHFVLYRITRSGLNGSAGKNRAGEQPPPMGDIVSQLRRLEPVFHRSVPGTTTRADFEAMTSDDFWEVGASGTIYDRHWCIEELTRRYADPTYDPMGGMAVDDFAVRPLSADVWLVTYRLFQGERETRRATVWRREGDRWVALYHQGTLVAPLVGPSTP